MAAKVSSADVSDAQLIARCLVGDDRHAFAELVKRHQSSVRACLRKLTAGNHALADDLAQEVQVDEDLAALAIFLASPRARYITGTVIPVDGGLRRYQF